MSIEASVESFSSARFATKRDGLFTACRSASGFWRTESGVVKSDHEMVMGGWTPVSLVKVRAGALREAAAGFIDWEVMYGREQATPEVEASHRSADYLMREADRIEGVVEWARVFEE